MGGSARHGAGVTALGPDPPGLPTGQTHPSPTTRTASVGAGTELRPGAAAPGRGTDSGQGRASGSGGSEHTRLGPGPSLLATAPHLPKVPRSVSELPVLESQFLLPKQVVTPVQARWKVSRTAVTSGRHSHTPELLRSYRLWQLGTNTRGRLCPTPGMRPTVPLTSPPSLLPQPLVGGGLSPPSQSARPVSAPRLCVDALGETTWADNRPLGVCHVPTLTW